MRIRTHTHTHNSLSLSPSLSHTHTHTLSLSHSHSLFFSLSCTHARANFPVDSPRARTRDVHKKKTQRHGPSSNAGDPALLPLAFPRKNAPHLELPNQCSTNISPPPPHTHTKNKPKHERVAGAFGRRKESISVVYSWRAGTACLF